MKQAVFKTKVNPAKREIVAQLGAKVESAKGIIFTDFGGLSVAEINKLRTAFFDAGQVEYIVSKNTLFKIILRDKGFPNIDGVLVGNTAIAIGYDDPVKPIKIISDFAKDMNGKPVFKGGFVDGEWYPSEQLEVLKDLPPREQLIAMVISGLASPLSGFIGVLNEVLRSFIGVIDAIIEKREG